MKKKQCVNANFLLKIFFKAVILTTNQRQFSAWIITYNLILKALPAYLEWLFFRQNENLTKKKIVKAKQTDKNLGHITYNDILPCLTYFALCPQPIVYLKN